jgi:hypothetical protein
VYQFDGVTAAEAGWKNGSLFTWAGTGDGRTAEQLLEPITVIE